MKRKSWSSLLNMQHTAKYSHMLQCRAYSKCVFLQIAAVLCIHLYCFLFFFPIIIKSWMLEFILQPCEHFDHFLLIELISKITYNVQFILPFPVILKTKQQSAQLPPLQKENAACVFHYAAFPPTTNWCTVQFSAIHSGTVNSDLASIFTVQTGCQC